VEFIQLALDTEQWWALAKIVMTFLLLSGECIDWLCGSCFQEELWPTV
jgi:hypothetical protein